jgi:uncharacterized protein with HEPN domain
VSRTDEERVRDILEAADGVAVVVARGREAWRDDWLARRAVERLLEIIGESARAMSEEGWARYPQVPWPKIVDMRTLLAHHYHRVDPEQVWVVAAGELPDLTYRLRRRTSG